VVFRQRVFQEQRDLVGQAEVEVEGVVGARAQLAVGIDQELIAQDPGILRGDRDRAGRRVEGVEGMRRARAEHEGFIAADGGDDPEAVVEERIRVGEAADRVGRELPAGIVVAGTDVAAEEVVRVGHHAQLQARAAAFLVEGALGDEIHGAADGVGRHGGDR
jgi:hypothetical protein